MATRQGPKCKKKISDQAAQGPRCGVQLAGSAATSLENPAALKILRNRGGLSLTAAIITMATLVLLALPLTSCEEVTATEQTRKA